MEAGGMTRLMYIHKKAGRSPLVDVARGELVGKELTAFIEKRDRQRHGAGGAWQLVLGGEA
jgi:hypothetical protein